MKLLKAIAILGVLAALLGCASAVKGATVQNAKITTKEGTPQQGSPVTHRTVETNGIRLHIAEQGSGPLGVSGDAPRDGRPESNLAMVPVGGQFLRGTPAPQILPSWLTESDVDFYAAEFQRTGFRGALNWYRNVDRNWELLAPYADTPMNVPPLYLLGDRDFMADEDIGR